MRLLKPAVLLSLLGLLAPSQGCAGTATKASQKTVSLRIIETTDVHGHFFSKDLTTGKEVPGGISRAKPYVDSLRSVYGDRLLLVDNGDILQGLPLNYYSNYLQTDEPNISARIVNYMDYDVQNIGNHDIEAGHQVFDKWIAETKCPVLGANIIDSITGKTYVAPYHLFQRDGVKIAVLGLVTHSIPFWVNHSAWQAMGFLPIVEQTRQWVEWLKEGEHADLIVGLFHSGWNGGITLGDEQEDAVEQMAREIGGLDVILYGHDHRQRTEWIANDSTGHDILCINPSCNAMNIADVSIEMVYEDGRLTEKHIDGSIVDISQKAADTAMEQHFKSFTSAVSKYMKQKVGKCDSTVCMENVFFGPSALIDFIHDIQLRHTGADISLTAPLYDHAVLNKGTIRMSDLFDLYRYENKLVVMTLTGEEIRNHLEMSYDLWANTMTSPRDHALRLRPAGKTSDEPQKASEGNWEFANMTFNFDSAAGIVYEVDLRKPDGEKVHILKTCDGEPFCEDKTYKVALNSYRANGGGELLTKGAGLSQEDIKERIVFRSEENIRSFIEDEFRQKGTIHPKVGSTWKFIPEEWTEKALEADRKLIFGE